MPACSRRTLRTNPATLHVPAFGRKWRGRERPDRQGSPPCISIRRECQNHHVQPSPEPSTKSSALVVSINRNGHRLRLTGRNPGIEIFALTIRSLTNTAMMWRSKEVLAWRSPSRPNPRRQRPRPTAIADDSATNRPGLRPPLYKSFRCSPSGGSGGDGASRFAMACVCPLTRARRP
jgi:hypothetical protein